MRRVDIDNVQKGSKLARSIIGNNGLILLNQGTILTVKFIERLKNLGFTSVYIDDGLIDDVEVEEVILEKTRLQAVNCIREVIENIREDRPFNVSSLKSVVSNIIDDLKNNKEILLSLSDIRSYDDYTFNHSVNVTIVSIMIGMGLYYTYERLVDLGLGVLLHDIGKIEIPPQIINKPGQLTREEYEIIKQHTWHGFEIIRGNPEIKITSAHVALQHHERYDGIGYPRGLKGDDILEFARISTIADVYDALSNDRSYRKRLPSDKVYEILINGSGEHFDPIILERFMQKIAIYPTGTKVMLNDGRSGFVIKQNNMASERPVIRLFWYLDGRKMEKPIEVNLLYESKLSIVEVL